MLSKLNLKNRILVFLKIVALFQIQILNNLWNHYLSQDFIEGLTYVWSNIILMHFAEKIFILLKMYIDSWT